MIKKEDIVPGMLLYKKDKNNDITELYIVQENSKAFRIIFDRSNPVVSLINTNLNYNALTIFKLLGDGKCYNNLKEKCIKQLFTRRLKVWQ
jgi:hypothetical protein